MKPLSAGGRFCGAVFTEEVWFCYAEHTAWPESPKNCRKHRLETGPEDGV